VLDSSFLLSVGELGRSAKRLLWKQKNRKLLVPLPLFALLKGLQGELELEILTRFDLPGKLRREVSFSINKQKYESNHFAAKIFP
jgi:hypothetical protein